MSYLRRTLSYPDVLLVPRYSGLDSRSDADIDFEYKLPDLAVTLKGPPITNSPMDTVCSPELINYLQSQGLITTIHRYFEDHNAQLDFLARCDLPHRANVFLSVGSVYRWKEWVDQLMCEWEESKQEDRFGLLVDMANGDTKACVDTVAYIRNTCPGMMIMAGNVATKSGYKRLAKAGANFIRVGIGSGACCSTRSQTGFGVPVLTSIQDCVEAKAQFPNTYLIADGGINDPGDICKAICAGADMIMTGTTFAATSMSPGKKVTSSFKTSDSEHTTYYAEYRGMASKAARDDSPCTGAGSVEGVSGYIPYTGKTEDVLQGILTNLETSMAYYAGCRNWTEFRCNVKMVEITHGGLEESKTHLTTGP